MTKTKSLRSGRWFSVFVFTMTALAALGMMSCKPGNKSAANSGAAQPGEAGVEKLKPAPGTGNVQGKVLFNSKPVENI